ncbi:MAG: tRNA (adenosine(37)-N6)-threonylcarbamoyltransferase complex ATPase subunit type 1 TsaE [Rectinema sp.]
MKEFLSRDAQDSMALGERIGKLAPSGGVVAFRGDLGAGKTTLAKGVARGLDIAEEVSSPTFTIVSEYTGGRLLMRHIDAYRLSGDADFSEIGGPEMLGEAGTLCLVEWSERLPESFGPETCTVDIRVEPDGVRRIRLSGSWIEEAAG